jgi:hypothetical protein
MKNLIRLILISFCALIILDGCVKKVHPVTGGLPPGQAKKLTGAKSAKAYAPGQKNKH